MDVFNLFAHEPEPSVFGDSLTHSSDSLDNYLFLESPELSNVLLPETPSYSPGHTKDKRRKASHSRTTSLQSLEAASQFCDATFVSDTYSSVQQHPIMDTQLWDSSTELSHPWPDADNLQDNHLQAPSNYATELGLGIADLSYDSLITNHFAPPENAPTELAPATEAALEATPMTSTPPESITFTGQPKVVLSTLLTAYWATHSRPGPVAGNVYMYPDDETASPITKLHLEPAAYNLPYTVHRQIVATVKHEFHYEDRFLKMKGQLRPSTPKKRRNPIKDDNVWVPELIYRAYTNIRPDNLFKTEYPDKVPTSSCWGMINMREKGAWTRGPSRRYE